MIEVKMGSKFTRMSIRRQKKKVNKMIYGWVIDALRNVGVCTSGVGRSRSKKTARIGSATIQGKYVYVTFDDETF